MNIERPVCQTCGGTGSVETMDCRNVMTCHDCGGSGIEPLQCPECGGSGYDVENRGLQPRMSHEYALPADMESASALNTIGESVQLLSRRTEEKALKCIEIAKRIFSTPNLFLTNRETGIKIDDTALDLMRLPEEQLDSIYERLEIKAPEVFKNNRLTRFELLKKKD